MQLSGATIPSQLRIEAFKMQVQMSKHNQDALARLKTESVSHPSLRAAFSLQTAKLYIFYFF